MATQYKDIVVHLDNTAASAVRLDIAVDLATRFDAHLSGVCVENDLDIPILKGMPTPSFLKEELADRERARIQSIHDGFEASMEEAQTRGEWRTVEGPLVQALRRQAHCSDLLVVGHNRDHDPVNIITSPVASVALVAGVPVLVVPDVGAERPMGRRIIVAWDGGREAIRAVHDGLPLLATAATVEIVTIASKSMTPAAPVPGSDIALHLGRLGVKAESVTLPAGHADVATTLLAHAADTGADAVVMGAFGHSRVRELVLGGATREVIHTMNVPVLLSH